MAKLTKILIEIIIVLIVVLLVGAKILHNERQKSTRLYSNMQTMAQGVHISHNGTAASIRVLNLRVREIKELYPTIEHEIKSLSVKLKNAKTITNTVTQHNHTFKTTVRDSVIYDTIPAQFATYVDAFTYFNWLYPVGSDSALVTYQVTDSLLQVVSAKRPAGFPFGWGWFNKKQLVQDVKTLNPNTKIKYSRVLEVK